MKLIKTLCIIGILSFFLSCFDDGSTPGAKGVLKITVKTSGDVWGYPQLKTGSTTDYEAYAGDTLYTWQYSEVGGDDTASSDPECYMSTLPIPQPDTSTGDKINIVYLYSSLGEKSNSTPVIYNGRTSENDQVITISDIVTGAYYIVAFYDYSYGGNQQNLLNRYDRYTIYTDTVPLSGTAYSTPFVDNASTITISENQIVEITLEIKRDWVIGKPKTADGGTGRLFLKSTEAIPAP